MTFTTTFAGNETDRSGTATFSVGSIERDVHFANESDFNAVAQLLNEAYSLGREEGLDRMPWPVMRLNIYNGGESR